MSVIVVGGARVLGPGSSVGQGWVERSRPRRGRDFGKGMNMDEMIDVNTE